ncbi:SusC/RagA family TonB-linked outer membrane protein [Pedobacter sp. N23S346]|uniref:SusC/RagA family TonB-linked outer membrane protein n=1 Tax=Pedobacter sp. N23S346 TaxID=3402750 RepID=UPI003ACD62C5
MQLAFTVKAQNITISKKNASLTEVFREIRKQTGYDFVLPKDLLKDAKPVTIQVKNADLEDVLKICFESQPFTYKVNNKVIIVFSETQAVSPGKIIGGPEIINIRGRVLNDEGEPLENATVRAKGNLRAATTNQDGVFHIEDIETGTVLSISYVGYRTIEVKVTVKLNEIRLSTDKSPLDEVKVIAYGTTTSRKSTGEISTVTAQDIARQPASDILQVLQGRVAGLVVRPSSGFFSGNYSVKIRGNNSIPINGENAVSDPLYVVDGVPLTAGSGDPNGGGINQNGIVGPVQGQNPLLYLNPSDIESISVLKDADATALYGSRGANGVILITTKKAKPGKTQVDVNVYTGYSQQTKKLELMNTQQYLAMRREALKNDGLIPDNQNAYDLLVWDTTRNVNWQKQLLETAKTTDAQIGFSGGDEKTTFRLNTGYHQETPPFPGNFSERRVSSLLNIGHSDFNGKLRTNLIVNYANTYSNLPASDITGSVLQAPHAPDIYNAAGNLNFGGWRPADFPRAFTSLEKPYKANTNNFSSSLVVDYSILANLHFNVSGAYNLTNQNQTQLNPGTAQDPDGIIRRESTFGENNYKTWVLEPTLKWTLPLKNSNLETLIGATYQESIADGNRISLGGFTNDKQLEDKAAASEFFLAGSNYTQTKIQSVYARVNYSLLDKYIINVNLRRDGSSRFGPGNQFGNFGSVGAAWLFNEEKLVKDAFPFLSFGKLTGSYGTTGGDQIGDYAYLSTYTSGSAPYDGNPVLLLNNADNPDYKWTVNKKLNVSLNLGFFQDRLLFTSTYFRNRTGNQLVYYQLPALTGFSSVIANLPALVQNKGYEFQLTSKNIQTDKISWSTSANLSINRNKLLAFPGLESSTYASQFTIGQPISRTALYHYTGLDTQTGTYTFEDKNNNGTLDPIDDQSFYNNDPSFTGGIDNNLQFGNLSFSFFFIFTRQKGFENIYNFVPGASQANQSTALIDDHWQMPGDNKKYARFTTYGEDIVNYGQSDALWVDASYIRLQNVSLSYRLPSTFWPSKHMPSTTISLQGQNLWTITGYKGTDPSNPGLQLALPSRRFLTARVQFIF